MNVNWRPSNPPVIDSLPVCTPCVFMHFLWVDGRLRWLRTVYLYTLPLPWGTPLWATWPARSGKSWTGRWSTPTATRATAVRADPLCKLCEYWPPAAPPPSDPPGFLSHEPCSDCCQRLFCHFSLPRTRGEVGASRIVQLGSQLKGPLTYIRPIKAVGFLQPHKCPEPQRGVLFALAPSAQAVISATLPFPPRSGMHPVTQFTVRRAGVLNPAGRERMLVYLVVGYWWAAHAMLKRYYQALMMARRKDGMIYRLLLKYQKEN